MGSDEIRERVFSFFFSLFFFLFTPSRICPRLKCWGYYLVLSCNIRGARDKRKRSAFFIWLGIICSNLLKLQYLICLLQNCIRLLTSEERDKEFLALELLLSLNQNTWTPDIFLETLKAYTVIPQVIILIGSRITIVS